MRIAVLSMLEPLAVDGLMTRAGLRVNAESVVEQQFALALAAGAKRLLILADRRAVGLDELVSEASEKGLDVRVVADAPALCGEVTAADELVVLGDALLTDPALSLPLLKSGGVVTVPVEEGLAAGFERIDAENAWGGILVIPGALAERLRQLPRDCDVASSLLRIALMAGVAVRPVDAQAIADKRWTIVRSEAEAQAIEAHRLRLSLAQARGRTPGRALAGFLVSRFGDRLFEADRSPALVWWAALLPAAATIALAAFGVFQGAFFAIALCWLIVRAAMIFDAADRQGRIASALPDRRPFLSLLGIDALLLGVIGLALLDWRGAGVEAAFETWCIALTFVGLARIGGASFPIQQARGFFDDRFSQAILLQLALFGDVFVFFTTVAVMSVILAWTGILTFGNLRERR